MVGAEKEVYVKGKSTDTPLSVYMPENEKQEIREYAGRIDRSVSWVIRSLLRKELTHQTLARGEGNRL